MTFFERVGGILIAPRRVLAEASESGQRGAADVAILVGLKLIAAETPRIARGVAQVPSLGAGAVLRAFAQSLAAVLPDLLAILVAVIAMALFAGARAASRGRESDVAPYAWVPYLAVTLAAALVDTALQRAPGTPEQIAAGAGALWSVAVWALGLIELRREAPSVAR